MNLKNRLRHLAGLNLRDVINNVHDTKRVSLINVAKDNGGLLVTTTIHEAKTLERRFGISARSMDVNLSEFGGPFYFDPDATEQILLRAANKIEALEKEVEDLKKGIVTERPSDPESLALETYEDVSRSSQEG